MQPSTVFSIGQVIGICLTLAGTLTGILLLGGWWLRGRFSDVETSIGDARKDIDFEIQSMKSWLGSLLIHLRGKMDEDKLVDLTQRLNFKANATGNPISQEQANKINSYIAMVTSKAEFTPEQASEFKLLTETYASDPDVRKEFGRDKLDTLLMISGSVFARYFLKINS